MGCVCGQPWCFRTCLALPFVRDKKTVPSAVSPALQHCSLASQCAVHHAMAAPGMVSSVACSWQICGVRCRHNHPQHPRTEAGPPVPQPLGMSFGCGKQPANKQANACQTQVGCLLGRKTHCTSITAWHGMPLRNNVAMAAVVVTLWDSGEQLCGWH